MSYITTYFSPSSLSKKCTKVLSSSTPAKSAILAVASFVDNLEINLILREETDYFNLEKKLI